MSAALAFAMVLGFVATATASADAPGEFDCGVFDMRATPDPGAPFPGPVVWDGAATGTDCISADNKTPRNLNFAVSSVAITCSTYDADLAWSDGGESYTAHAHMTLTPGTPAPTLKTWGAATISLDSGQTGSGPANWVATSLTNTCISQYWGSSAATPGVDGEAIGLAPPATQYFQVPAPGIGAAADGSGDIDVCEAGTGIDIFNHEISGFGFVHTCTERTEILSAKVTLWQKTLTGGYHKLTSQDFPGGAVPATPPGTLPNNAEGYSTPSLTSVCKKGARVHVQFSGTFSASAGVGPYNKNSDPRTCK